MTIQDALTGQETPMEVADDYWGGHMSDLVGYFKGEYRQAANAPVTASKRDDAAERNAFRSWVAVTILAGCEGAEHPLRKLLDPSGKPYPAGDRYDFVKPIFDGGHPLSRDGGGRGMGIEWPASNRYDGSQSEKQGVILEKPFVLVCGVPIELSFLRAAEAGPNPLVPKGTTAKALGSPTGGYAPGTGLVPARGLLPGVIPTIGPAD